MWKISLISLALMLSSCTSSVHTTAGPQGPKGATGSNGVTGGGTDYYVGDTGPAGGLVFYDRGRYTTGLANNWRYMEAAPDDQSSTQIWSNITAQLVGTDRAIGGGQANTLAIIAQPGHTDSAAKLCDDLVVGDYSDWFLPSVGELYQMYANLGAGGLGSFVSGQTYWSSSEYDDSNVWNYYLFAEGLSTINKSYIGAQMSTRCIRAF
jgi:hypothetical protein